MAQDVGGSSPLSHPLILRFLEKNKNVSMNRIVLIDESLCISCGACIEICPKKIFFIDNKTQKCNVSEEEKCDKIKGCEKICPTEAIKIKD